MQETAFWSDLSLSITSQRELFSAAGEPKEDDLSMKY